MLGRAWASQSTGPTFESLFGSRHLRSLGYTPFLHCFYNSTVETVYILQGCLEKDSVSHNPQECLSHGILPLYNHHCFTHYLHILCVVELGKPTPLFDLHFQGSAPHQPMLPVFLKVCPSLWGWAAT